jgi:tol-pal system protein YbgF
MRLKTDRCGAYGPLETNPIRKTPVTPLFRSGLIAALAGWIALAAPAHAQFDIFHRQAAPPADIPGDAPGDPNDAAGLVVRINRLEEELHQAYGRIEELQNAQRQLAAQLQKFRQDVEFRFGDRSGGAPPESDVAEAPLAPDEPGVPPKPRRSDAFNPDADPNAPGAPRPLGTTPPSAPLVRESAAPPARQQPAPGAPLELGKGQPTAPPPSASGPTIVGTGVAMLDQPHEQFNAALQAFQAGQYPEAETGFKAFIAANPAHRLTPDAVFYIGESHFQRARPDDKADPNLNEAAAQYLKVTTDYSKSSRAAQSMVRLGQTLAALGNSVEACATLTEFGKRYPAASASVKKLAEHESAKDHC